MAFVSENHRSFGYDLKNRYPMLQLLWNDISNNPLCWRPWVLGISL
jgi:hypothetical protein